MSAIINYIKSFSTEKNKKLESSDFFDERILFRLINDKAKLKGREKFNERIFFEFTVYLIMKVSNDKTNENGIKAIGKLKPLENFSEEKPIVFTYQNLKKIIEKGLQVNEDLVIDSLKRFYVNVEKGYEGHYDKIINFGDKELLDAIGINSSNIIEYLFIFYKNYGKEKGVINTVSNYFSISGFSNIGPASVIQIVLLMKMAFGFFLGPLVFVQDFFTNIITITSLLFLQFFKNNKTTSGLVSKAGNKVSSTLADLLGYADTFTVDIDITAKQEARQYLDKKGINYANIATNTNHGLKVSKENIEFIYDLFTEKTSKAQIMARTKVFSINDPNEKFVKNIRKKINTIMLLAGEQNNPTALAEATNHYFPKFTGLTHDINGNINTEEINAFESDLTDQVIKNCKKFIMSEFDETKIKLLPIFRIKLMGVSYLISPVNIYLSVIIANKNFHFLNVRTLSFKYDNDEDNYAQFEQMLNY